MKKKYNLLLVLLVFAIAFNAKNYYISSSTGNDVTGDGSKSKPYKSFTKFDTSNTIGLVGGDSVLLKGGDTFTSTLMIYNASGNANADIVVSSYDNVVGAETNNAVIKITSLSGYGIATYSSFLTIRDLIISGPWDQYNTSGSSGAGIVLGPISKNLGSVAVIGCDISGFKIGIYAYYNNVFTKNVFTTVNLMYNYVHECGKAGIDISAVVPNSDNHIYAYGNLICYKNYIYNNLAGECSNASTCGHNGDGAVFGSFAKGCMSHNVVFHNGWLNKSLPAGPAGLWVWDSDSIMIEYNEAYDCGTMPGAGDGDGFDLDGGVSNSTMQYNYSHDNWAAGYLLWNLGGMRTNTRNNTIRYNISENDNIGYPLKQWNKDHFGGITIASGCTDSKIYNNTISSKFGPCIKTEVGGSSPGFEIYNNILYSQAPANQLLIDVQSTGCLFLNNCYYSVNGFLAKIGSTTYSTFGDGTANDFKNSGNETSGNGMLADPKLKMPLSEVNVGDFSLTNFTNYQLQAGSPAKDKGLDLTASPYKWNIGKNDYNGLSIPAGSGHDIGACEAR